MHVLNFIFKRRHFPAKNLSSGKLLLKKYFWLTQVKNQQQNEFLANIILFHSINCEVEMKQVCLPSSFGEIGQQFFSLWEMSNCSIASSHILIYKSVTYLLFFLLYLDYCQHGIFCLLPSPRNLSCFIIIITIIISIVP